MGDDLTTPKGGVRLSAFARRIPLLSGLLYFTIAALLGALLYVLVVDDPLGGEPVAVAPIRSAPAPTNPPSEPLEMRSSLDGTAPDRGDQLDFAVAPADIVIGETEATSPAASGAVAELVELSRYGPLPVIAQDGRRAADIYAASAPYVGADIPRIAILVGGMGLSATVTEDAIRRLPRSVTLAFAPYGREVERLTGQARQAGHEIMLQVPLEPYDYPDNDPGPHTLLTDLSDEQNRDRLHWVMSRFTGYVGVTNYMGGRFTSSERLLRPFLGELRERGLIYADDASSPRSLAAQVAGRLALPFVAADVIIDANPTRSAIGEALSELEDVAKQHGRALGVATGLPAGIEEIAEWAQTLESKGYVLIPVTALLQDAET